MKRLIDDIMSLLRSAKEYVCSLNMSDTVKVRYTINQLIKDVVLGEQMQGSGVAQCMRVF